MKDRATGFFVFVFFIKKLTSVIIVLKLVSKYVVRSSIFLWNCKRRHLGQFNFSIFELTLLVHYQKVAYRAPPPRISDTTNMTL
jgi:hypothetical protein